MSTKTNHLYDVLKFGIYTMESPSPEMDKLFEYKCKKVELSPIYVKKLITDIAEEISFAATVEKSLAEVNKCLKN